LPLKIPQQADIQSAKNESIQQTLTFFYLGFLLPKKENHYIRNSFDAKKMQHKPSPEKFHELKLGIFCPFVSGMGSWKFFQKMTDRSATFVLQVS